jgi:hypothetical protein
MKTRDMDMESSGGYSGWEPMKNYFDSKEVYLLNQRYGWKLTSLLEKGILSKKEHDGIMDLIWEGDEQTYHFAINLIKAHGEHTIRTTDKTT